MLRSNKWLKAYFLNEMTTDAGSWEEIILKSKNAGREQGDTGSKEFMMGHKYDQAVRNTFCSGSIEKKFTSGPEIITTK